MQPTPKWYMPVAVVALLWNILGCVAYLADAMLSPEAIAMMSSDQQALYASRPAWSVGATAIAVWFGALGCVGLIMKKRWAAPLLLISLVGVLFQDLWLFVLSNAGAVYGAVAAYSMQGIVLIVAVGLVMLSRRAVREGWIT